MKPLTIWCNAGLLKPSEELLQRSIGNHKLVFPPGLQEYNLVPSSEPDPLMNDADIAFGQPDPQQVIAQPRLKWVHLTSAGYTRYDNSAFKDAIKARGGAFTNSSSVYDEPCAEHVLAMMLSLARQFPAATADQLGQRAYLSPQLRLHMTLLIGQVVSIYGFGAIARRLVELLAPFRMTIRAARRSPSAYPGVTVLTPDGLDAFLGEADHVIDILPASTETDCYFNADRLRKMKASAFFYNIGRGSTVDQTALRTMLETHQLAAAYLDVTMPEPLAPDDLLWSTPNCFITPHNAGGHHDEFDRLVLHFLENLRRYEQGQPLRDRIV